MMLTLRGKRPHQPASRGYTPGDSTSPFYLTPAVVIRDWQQVSLLGRKGQGSQEKGEKDIFIKLMHGAQLTADEEKTLQVGRTY